MSLTYELDSTAQTFKSGLFASKVSALLDREGGSVLSAADRETANAAARCVEDLLKGAEILHSGQSGSGATANSIKSLGVALAPLQNVQRQTNKTAPSDEFIITLLTKMEKGLSGLVKSPAMPSESEELRLAKTFFSLVADSLLSSLTAGRKRGSDPLSIKLA